MSGLSNKKFMEKLFSLNQQFVPKYNYIQHFKQGGFYPARLLQKIRIKDEDRKVRFEFGVKLDTDEPRMVRNFNNFR